MSGPSVPSYTRPDTYGAPLPPLSLFKYGLSARLESRKRPSTRDRVGHGPRPVEPSRRTSPQLIAHAVHRTVDNVKEWILREGIVAHSHLSRIGTSRPRRRHGQWETAQQSGWVREPSLCGRHPRGCEVYPCLGRVFFCHHYKTYLHVFVVFVTDSWSGRFVHGRNPTGVSSAHDLTRSRVHIRTTTTSDRFATGGDVSILHNNNNNMFK